MLTAVALHGPALLNGSQLGWGGGSLISGLSSMAKTAIDKAAVQSAKVKPLQETLIKISTAPDFVDCDINPGRTDGVVDSRTVAAIANVINCGLIAELSGDLGKLVSATISIMEIWADEMGIKNALVSLVNNYADKINKGILSYAIARQFVTGGDSIVKNSGLPAADLAKISGAGGRIQSFDPSAKVWRLAVKKGAALSGALMQLGADSEATHTEKETSPNRYPDADEVVFAAYRLMTGMRPPWYQDWRFLLPMALGIGVIGYLYVTRKKPASSVGGYYDYKY